jgi:hypothetical protein
VRTKRGYLAALLLAGVMVAGYVGLLPLLQSLAAEPVWPDAPGASQQAAPPVITVDALDATALAASKPSKATTRRPQVTVQQRASNAGRPSRTSRAASTRPAAPRSGGLGQGGLSDDGAGNDPGVTVGG